MSFPITIAGTTIDFPNTGAAPINSEPIIQFAVAVEQALSGLITAGDIAKQFYTLTNADLAVSNVPITNLSFSNSAIQAGFIRYSVYRVRGATSVVEAGQIYVAYNTAAGTWSLSRDYTGEANISFEIDSNGQVNFTTTSIGSSGSHSGKIIFTAQSLAQ